MNKYKEYNQWLRLNDQLIESVIRSCLEYSFSGNYGGQLPLDRISNLLKGASREIRSLHSENQALSHKIAKMEKDNG